MEFTNGFLFGAGAALAFGALWLLFILARTKAFWICVLVVFLVLVHLALFEYIQAYGDFVILAQARHTLFIRLYNWVRSLNLAEFSSLSLVVYVAVGYGILEELASFLQASRMRQWRREKAREAREAHNRDPRVIAARAERERSRHRLERHPT